MRQLQVMHVAMDNAPHEKYVQNLQNVNLTITVKRKQKQLSRGGLQSIDSLQMTPSSLLTAQSQKPSQCRGGGLARSLT